MFFLIHKNDRNTIRAMSQLLYPSEGFTLDACYIKQYKNQYFLIKHIIL